MPERPHYRDRHIGPDAAELQRMLAAVDGGASLEKFIERAVPASILAPPPELPERLSEQEALRELERYASQNGVHKPLLGLGFYGSVMPVPIRRLLFENPSWYTAYTPYQAEISQGRLELLLCFQTMVADLCGLDMANASLLDEASAAAEAMIMLWRVAPDAKRAAFLVDADTHPQNIEVLRTRAEPCGIDLRICADAVDFQKHADQAFGALMSYPCSSGRIVDWRGLIAELRERKVPTVACTDLLALMLLESPGALGASVAVGSAQRFGLPLGAGGPHAGFIALEKAYMRKAPGRIVGIAPDSEGRMAFRLSLQTREQHIRRDRATSNICTAQSLPAMIAAAYAIYHGPAGLRSIAARVHGMARGLAEALTGGGCKLVHQDYFDTLCLEHPQAQRLADQAAAAGFDLRCADGRLYLSCDETVSEVEAARLAEACGGKWEGLAKGVSSPHAELARTAAPLRHKVFNANTSEHAFMRLLRRLAAKDIALDRSMIPLGSCTMKLNAATAMQSLASARWNEQHPFAPPARLAGMNALAAELGEFLTRLTGFDAVSFQPNAGSQGEYAGLLAIRGWHREQGGAERCVCLIPASAHGTNAASAAMVGMEVQNIAVDAEGGVDLDDLRAKIDAAGARLAAMMVTYPSTCGIYNESLGTACELVHKAGGLVYMDGANLNALVGIALPGKLGPDIMHINLHKTFCIPHGGGGPGAGPVVCTDKLRPFLPGHWTAVDGRTDGGISAAPLGSGMLLAISWAYIRMMGAAGLRAATGTAVLAANYMQRQLEQKYRLAFKSSSGWCAHEFVLDLSEFKDSAGVTVEDVAKRLIDMGFHAPTVSFPQANCMMIEPTESEGVAELDRFCEALVQIRAEIEKVAQGEWPRDDNPLVNAPHPAADLLDGNARSYTPAEAAYPLAWIKDDKYWPPVSRIDQVKGDRSPQLVLAPDMDPAPSVS